MPPKAKPLAKKTVAKKGAVTEGELSQEEQERVVEVAALTSKKRSLEERVLVMRQRLGEGEPAKDAGGELSLERIGELRNAISKVEADADAQIRAKSKWIEEAEKGFYTGWRRDCYVEGLENEVALDLYQGFLLGDPFVHWNQRVERYARNENSFWHKGRYESLSPVKKTNNDPSVKTTIVVPKAGRRSSGIAEGGFAAGIGGIGDRAIAGLTPRTQEKKKTESKDGGWPDPDDLDIKPNFSTEF